jgi:hypothetical protein
MSTVTIKTVTQGAEKTPKLQVLTPYHPDFPAGARNLGGTWHASSKSWLFDPRDDERVRDLCKKIYGTDGTAATGDLVTLKITATEYQEEFGGGIFLAGRCLATAFGRDSGAKLGEGIVLLAGKATSGGSVKNWKTLINAGTILEVKDVPRAAVPENGEDGWEIEVVEPAAAPTGASRADALRQQLAALQAQIAEIEGELAQTDVQEQAGTEAVPAKAGSPRGCQGQLWEECPICGTEPVCAECGYCDQHGRCGGAPSQYVRGEIYGGEN